MTTGFFQKNKPVFLYGILLAFMLFLLKWLELRFIIISHSLDIYIGAIALIFTALGVWLASKLITPRVKIVEREIQGEKPQNFITNDKELSRLGLSKRELEVLCLMAEGHSNQEIAGKLFVSLNTVKTHASRIFEKMDVKRRTQAIEKAQKAGLIP